MCGKVRAAHTQRLGERWNYWSPYSSNSCQMFYPPTPTSCSVGSPTTNSLYVTVGGLPSGYGISPQISSAVHGWRAAGRVSGLAHSTTYTFYARSVANGVASLGTLTCPPGRTLTPVPSRPFNIYVARTDSSANGSWQRSSYATYYEYQLSVYDPVLFSYQLRDSGTVQEPPASHPLPMLTTRSISIPRSSPGTWEGDRPQVRVVARAVGPGGASGWATGYSAW